MEGFQRIWQGFGRDFNWFPKDLVKNLIDFHGDSKGFGKDWLGMSIDFQREKQRIYN